MSNMSETAVSIDEMKPFILEKNEFLLNNSDLFTKSQAESEVQRPIVISDIYSQAKYCEEDADNLKRAKTEELTYVDFSFDYSLKRFLKNNFKDETADVTWKRLSEIFGKNEYQVFRSGEGQGETEPRRFKRGPKGTKNVELKGAFDVIRRFKDEKYVTRLVSKDPEGWEVSAYEVKLNIGGIWNELIVDDYFPVVEGEEEENLTFCFMEPQGEENEILEMLIEKALAKAFNGYHKLNGIKVDQFVAHLTGVPVIKNRILDVDHLQFLDYSELNLAVLSDFESFERKIGVLVLSLKTGKPVLRLADSGEELEIASVENLEVYLVKLRPAFSYNSVHIPLSSSNFIQAVVKIGIQDEGTYTFQINQKPKQLYPKNSPFSYNKVCMTLAKLVEGGVEYVDHTRTSSEMTLTLTLNNIQFEGNYVLLIDVESNKRNYIYENQYKGDLGHWRDIVLSVYGTEYCRLDSLALDPNRGMIYDFFLHRTWKHFSRTHRCEDFNKPFIKENESNDVIDPKLTYVENHERRVWMLNLGEEYGDIEIIRECFIMENLMLFKFINKAEFNIEIVDLLMNKLDPNLECFGPFEVNNIDPSLLVNSKSDEILLFKYNNKLKSIKKLKVKNSNFAVSPCDNNNPEEYYGQDPYDYMTKLYTVQPSRTYPMCSFTVEVDGYIVNNLKKGKDELQMKMEAHDLYEIGDSCDLFEVIEGELFCKGPNQVVEVECFNGAGIEESHNFVDLEEEDEVRQASGQKDKPHGELLNPGSHLDEENNNFIFESARIGEEEREALAPKSDTETKVKVESELDYEQYYSREMDYGDNQEESVLIGGESGKKTELPEEDGEPFEEIRIEEPELRDELEIDEEAIKGEFGERKESEPCLFDANNMFQEPFLENPEKERASECMEMLVAKSEKHYVVSFGNSKCFNEGSKREIEEEDQPQPGHEHEPKSEEKEEEVTEEPQVEEEKEEEPRNEAFELKHEEEPKEDLQLKAEIEEAMFIQEFQGSHHTSLKSEKIEVEDQQSNKDPQQDQPKQDEEEEKIIVNTKDNFFNSMNKSFEGTSNNKIVHISSIELEPMTTTTPRTLNTTEPQADPASNQNEATLSFKTSRIDEFNPGLESPKPENTSYRKEKENVQKNSRSVSNRSRHTKKFDIKMQFKQTKKSTRPPKASKRNRVEDPKKKLKIRKRRGKSKSKSPNLNMKFKEDGQRTKRTQQKSKSKVRKPKTSRMKSSMMSNSTQNNTFLKQKVDPAKILRPWRNNMAVTSTKPWKMGNREAQRSQRRKSRANKSSRREISKGKPKPVHNPALPRRAAKKKRAPSRAKEGSKTRRKKTSSSNQGKKKRSRRVEKGKNGRTIEKNIEEDKENRVSGNKIEFRKIPPFAMPPTKKKTESKVPTARVSKKKVIEEIIKENFERTQNPDKKSRKRNALYAPAEVEMNGDTKFGLQSVLQQKIKKLKKDFNSTFYKNKQVQSMSSASKERSPENKKNCLFDSKLSKEEKMGLSEIKDIQKTMLKRSSRGYDVEVLNERSFKKTSIFEKVKAKDRKVVEVTMEKIVIVGEIKKRQARSYERKQGDSKIMTIPAMGEIKREAVSVELKKRRGKESPEVGDVRKKVIGENGEVLEGRPISISNPINYRA